MPRSFRQVVSDLLRNEDGFLTVTGSAPSGGGGAQTVTPTVINRSNEQVAPEVIMFNAETSGFPGVAAVTSVHDEQVQKIDFVWNFGDATSTFDYTTNTFGNSGNANTAIGKKVAHAYSTPGTYTVTVTAYMESGGTILSATNTLQVTVADVDTVYTRVAYVHPSGDYTGSPATSGSLNATTWSGAVDAIVADAGSGVTPTKIVVADDTTPTQTVYFGGLDDVNCPSLYTVRSGTGTNRPVVTYSGATGTFMLGAQAATGHASKDFIWTEVDVDCGWDAATETGTRTGFLQPLQDEPFGYFCLYNCLLENMSTAVSYTPSNTAYSVFYDDFRDTTSSMHVHNCDMTSFSDFIMISLCRNMSVVGCRQQQQANTNAGGPKDGTRNNHSGVRLMGENVYVAKNQLASSTGWVPQGSYLGQQLYTHQAPIRINTNPQLDGYYNVTENYVEGGIEFIMTQSANGNALQAINFQYESNMLVSSWYTNRAIGNSNSGGRIVNNVWVIPDLDYSNRGGDVTWPNLGGPNYMIEPDFDDRPTSSTENDNGTIVIYNNTIFNRSATEALTGLIHPDASNGHFSANTAASGSASMTFTTDRNLIHEPSVAGGTDYTLLGTSPFNALNSWDYNYFSTSTAIPNTATPAGTPTLGVPDTGSSAINAGTGGNLYTTRDIQGNTRSIPDDLGANVA